MPKCKYLLFLRNDHYICYVIICITVPLILSTFPKYLPLTTKLKIIFLFLTAIMLKDIQQLTNHSGRNLYQSYIKRQH